MSDLGSKAALQADINAKVTTNGNGENTGARVRAALTNMVDTLDGLKADALNSFFFATVNGVRNLYIEVFQGVDTNRYWSVNGVENVENAIFGASGLWVVNEGGNNVSASTDAVANPTLVTTWTGSATVVVEPVLYGPTVQDAMEQLASQVPPQYLIWEGYISQSDTSAPTVVELTNTLGETPVLAYSSTGTYTATLASAFPQDRTSWFTGTAAPSAGINRTITMHPSDNDTITIYSLAGGSLDDDTLSSTYFKIMVRV